MAVINLVIDAIGNTTPLFLENKTRWVEGSNTYATDERNDNGSSARCRPNAVPSVGRAGTICARRARRLALLRETFVRPAL